MSSGLSVRWWSILLMAGIFASAGANAEPAGSARAPTPPPHPLTVWVDAALARDPAQELLPALAGIASLGAARPELVFGASGAGAALAG